MIAVDGWRGFGFGRRDESGCADFMGVVFMLGGGAGCGGQGLIGGLAPHREKGSGFWGRAAARTADTAQRCPRGKKEKGELWCARCDMHSVDGRVGGGGLRRCCYAPLLLYGRRGGRT